MRLVRAFTSFETQTLYTLYLGGTVARWNLAGGKYRVTIELKRVPSTGNNWGILAAWPSRSRCCSRCGRLRLQLARRLVLQPPRTYEATEYSVLIMEAEVLNAYRAPWRMAGTRIRARNSAIVHYGATAWITAKYRGTSALLAQSRAPFHPGYCTCLYCTVEENIIKRSGGGVQECNITVYTTNMQ